MTEVSKLGKPSASIISLDKERNFWFDAIRGLSALAVCAGHLRAAAFVDFGAAENQGILQKLFYGLTAFGHESVMVFFVLSGFFVGGSVLKNVANFSVKSYAISRLTRLWLVLIPALLFTILIDLQLRSTSPDVLNGFYYKIWSSGPQTQTYSLSVTTFFGNIFFLQNITVPIFGSNSPLWSLANEFWYYLAFPSVLLLFTAKKSIKTRIAALTISMLLAMALSSLPLTVASGLLLGFFIWLMGVGVYYFKGFIGKYGKYYLLPFVLLFIAALAHAKTQNSSHFLNPDIAVGFTFALMATALVNIERPRNLPNILYKIVSWISDISYSLYLFHFPILMFLASIFHTRTQLQPDVRGICIYAVELSLLLGLCAVAWWLFERRTNEVRAVVERIFKRSTKIAGQSN